MRALLINPWSRTVTETEGEFRKLSAMYAALTTPELGRQVDDINPVRLTRQDFLWVDGEGLLFAGTPVWATTVYPGRLAGMGLVLGTTEEGDNCATTIDAERLASTITWPSLFTTGKLTEGRTEGNTFNMGQPILETK